MGLKKITILADVPTTTTADATGQGIGQSESGATAAIERLKVKKETSKPEVNKYSGRDFEKEARGKTRCATFTAALQSPSIAGLKFDTLEEFLELVKKAADAGVKYSFQD